MKRLFIICALMAIPALRMMAEVDPNFYIYICFGQSNMEGNAQPEAIDKKGIDKRFRLLATCDNSELSRTAGKWYKATPPLVSPAGGLGPTDYFGRTMCEALPDSIRIGVIPVAMGGSPIEMFDKDKYQQKMKDNPNEWWAILARNNYGGNPYGRIIEMAKKAQEVGVIKGILLHQGCSNNGDPNWPNMVKKIYNDMLKDLGLGTDSVPLFVGETLRQDQGGACYGHNTQVARMPSVVKNSYVISSEGCPGNGTDPWHFNAFGYRMLGSRYAGEALYTLGQHVKYCSLHDYDITLNKYATYDGTTQTLTANTSGNGLANWIYPHFADWSGSKYLVVKLKEAADPKVELRLYGKNKTIEYRDTLKDRTTMVVDLHNLKNNSKIMDPSNIYKIVMMVPKTTKIVFDEIFLSDDEAYGQLLTVRNISDEKMSSRAPIYSLDGRRANREALKPGIYVQKGKKMIVR